MKPKTKSQIEVFNLSKIVLDVNDKIRDWAFQECNDHIGIATKKKFWCIDCGEEHNSDIIQNDEVVCPTCKTKLKIVHSLKRTFQQTYYVAFAEALGEYQVIRLFEIISNHKKFEKASISIRENIQQFIPSDHNKTLFVARLCNTGGCEPRYGELEIRNTPYDIRKYNPLQYSFHPDSFFLPEYHKIGIDHNLQGLTFLTAYRTLSYSQAETLLKAKQYSLFNYFGVDNKSNIFKHWASIKIAIRRNYHVKDASLWLDYLNLLEYFGKDLRSPKYLFPTDLNREHDRLVEKKKVIEKKEEIKARQKRLKQEQEVYAARISDFKGLQFSSGKLTVKILESIQEFIQESETHKHCVYASKYYEKSDSLIFSATYDGALVETVEVSISKLQILQSRGLQNKASKYNKLIIKLVEDNLYQIEERLFQLQKTA